MTAPKHILFPLGTSHRELDSRLAMAVLAARPDNRLYIGPHETLMRIARRVKGGVYLGNNAIRPQAPDALDDYRLLKDRGFVFVHFDSRGAIFPGSEHRWREILRDRLDPRHLAADDFVCTWGTFQRDVYQQLDPPCRDNIRTTGHPHFDLYRRQWRSFYDAEATELRARYGDFLFITTDLGGANHRLGPAGLFDDDNGFRPNGSNQRDYTVKEWAYKNQQLSHIVRLVHRLHIVFPDVPIVIRPASSENPDFYRMVFRGLPSVHVHNEGSLAPWLLACRCMIHDGCATGVEAHLGDSKIINFRPVDDALQELFLPNQFGVRCDSEDQVVDCLVELFHTDGRRTPFDNPPLIDNRARRLLHNLCDHSFPTMIDVLAEAQEQVDHTDAPPELALHTEETFHDTLDGIKRLIQPLSQRRQHRKSRTHEKSPGFAAGDIQARFSRLQSLTSRRVEHNVVSRNLVVVANPR